MCPYVIESARLYLFIFNNIYTFVINLKVGHGFRPVASATGHKPNP